MTASRSDDRARVPRSTVVGVPPSLPSWAATSLVTRSLAVAVVASTGTPESAWWVRMREMRW